MNPHTVAFIVLVLVAVVMLVWGIREEFRDYDPDCRR